MKAIEILEYISTNGNEPTDADNQFNTFYSGKEMVGIKRHRRACLKHNLGNLIRIENILKEALSCFMNCTKFLLVLY
jgi:hypothetical protein